MEVYFFLFFFFQSKYIFILKLYNINENASTFYFFPVTRMSFMSRILTSVLHQLFRIIVFSK